MSRFFNALSAVRSRAQSTRERKKRKSRVSLMQQLEDRHMLAVLSNPSQPFATVDQPVAIGLGTFGSDASIDAVILGSGGDVTLASRASDDNWQAIETIDTGVGPQSTLVAERLSADPQTDLVTQSEDAITVLHGNIDGSFTVAQTIAAPSPGAFATGYRNTLAVDFVDADLSRDLVAVAAAGDSVLVYPGRAGGTFGSPVTYDTGVTSPTTVAVADVIGDNLPDLIVGHQDGSIVFFEGVLGSESLVRRDDLTLADAAAVTSFGEGDFDGDGNVDLAVTTSTETFLLFSSDDPRPVSTLVNGGFSAGLTGWEAESIGHDVDQTPGRVNGLGGRAQLIENDSFLTSLSQNIVIPPGATEISFDLVAIGLDPMLDAVPDAFEVSLLRSDGTSLVATHVPDSTAFFNVSSGSNASFASGVSFDGTKVALDVSALPAGTNATLMFDMIGNPPGTSSVASIDNVAITPDVVLSDVLDLVRLPGVFTDSLDSAVGDFDGDGNLDLVVTDSDETLAVYFGGGSDRSFLTELIHVSGFGSGLSSVAAGQLTSGDDVDDLILTLSGSDLALSPIGADVTAPDVDLVDPIAGETLRTFGGSFSLQFSEAVRTSGSGSVVDINAYGLFAAGADGELGTNDDVEIPLDSVSYDQQLRTATITVSAIGLPLADDEYRITLSGSDPATAIRDLVGNAIGGGSDLSFEFIVDALLSLNPPNTASANEGVEISISTQFDDPGRVGGYSATIDWGDGTVESMEIDLDSSGFAGTVSASHVYADNNTYEVSISLTDGDGGLVSASSNVQIANADPVFSNTNDIAASENTIIVFDLATITDPGFSFGDSVETLTATVDWGDGTPITTITNIDETITGPTGPTTATLTAMHSYASEGVYTVTITATDDDGGDAVTTLRAFISNTAPILAPIAEVAADEGASISVSGTYTDDDLDGTIDPASIHIVTIDWGDGSSNELTPTANNGNEAAFLANHIYADDGQYNVTVTVTDGDTGAAMQSTVASVSGVAPTTLSAADASVVSGVAAEFALITFSDPGFSNPAAGTSETFTAAIDWGDGSPVETTGTINLTNGGPGVPTTGSVSGTHTYLAAGTYTATITINDDDGLSGTSRISVIVEGESAEGACLPAIDFDHNVTGSTLSSGEIVTDQWSLWGVNVTTHDPINHPAMIFDSSMPSGGDTDLGSPHGDFGGPGIGGGGAAGTGSENASSLGNVLIISEDADSGDPDDDASGGTFIVTFDHPVRMDELGLLDLDSGEDSTITLFDVGGKVIGTTTMTGLGNNAAQTIVLDANNVARMEVELAGSGAITDLVFCRNLLAMSVFGDQTADEGDFYGALLLSPGVNVDDWNVFVTNGDGVQVSSIEFSNSDSPTLSTSFPDGQQNYLIKGWATDGLSVYPIEPFTVAVSNVDPILMISGDAEADAHLGYTIELSSDDPGDDEIIQWIVDWGDGTIETIPGDPGSATHVYEATGNYSITASAFDEDNASMGGRSGLVVIEAESFDASSPGTDNAATSTWVAASDPAASGEEYLLAAPNTGVNTGDSQRGPRLDYSVTFAEAGVYYVWVRMLGSSSQDDSLHVGLNGQPATYGKNGMTDYSGDWHWEQNVNNRNGTDRVAIDVASAGTHTINLWMREDGIAVDKLLITTDSDFQPTDLGPNALVTGEAYVSNTIQVTVDAGDSLWLPNVNFNVDDGGRQLASGDRITDQFASLGFTVSTTDPNHPAMIFDSSNPSGGDNDLGSPNSQYGGPGQGSGGVSNSVARGNVLIISEDNDANDPDDNVSGGALIFDFDQIVMVDEIGFLDVEGGDNRIELYDGDGVFISSTAIPDSGNNGYSRVALDALGVGRMEVHFAASGAITDIEFCRDGGHIPDAPTRFYVTDSDSDHVYRYDTIGESLGEFGAAAALNPRGITTTGEGNPVWIISEEDANERVYVYDTDGETLLGDWNARLLDSPEGIATDGTDIWVVDDGIDKVKRYSNAASRTSGQQFAASEFQLAFGNSDPRGITTDGQTLWTVDVVSKKVFAYEMDGTFVNWWNLDPANDDPAGITINPAGGDGIWIVDATDNAVYHYANATLAYQGDQAAVGVFALDGENSSPTGIADPAVLINVGDTVSGTLADAAQVDEYEFTKELAPLFIQVESVTGGEIRLNYDASFGGSATGIFGPGQVTELTYFDPGTFDFSVSVASGTPTYSVSLLEPPSPSFGVINQGDNVIDSIDAAYATDVWTFNGSAGQTVSIDVASDNGDLFLTIVDTSAVGGLGGAPPLYAGPFTDTGPLSLSSTGAYEISVFSPDAATTGYQFTLDGAALPTIELDTPVLGEIFTAGQADSYKLVGSVGQTLNFDVLTADLFTFSLVSPSGQTLFSDLMADIGPSGTVGRDQNEITLPEAGDYTVTVDSDGGEALSTGPYEFIVTEPAVTDSFINLGDFVSADISEAGEVDRFTFTLSADQSFELDFTSIVGGDLQALVSDGTNVLFTSPLSGTADDLDFGPQLTLPGTYTIEVSSGDSQTPSYEFSLLDGGNLATELTSGASISDEIANASEIDLYTFNAVSGDRVSVDFTTVSGGELAHELIAPNGATIQTASSASASVLGLSSLLLDQSGMYSLRLTGASGETPTYAFGFTRATTNPGIGIMLGQSVSGEINPAFEIDQYTFDVTTDQVFWLDFTSLSGSPVNVTLTSPSGAENTRVVSDTTDYDDSAPVTSSENGAWTISIAGTQPSTTGYAFTVWDVDPTETTTLNLDTLYSDSISSPGASDIYQLTASSGDEYFFNFAEIGTGNLRIDLIAPDGSSAFSERTSFPSIADTRLILEQDGTYELILRGEDSGTPTYGFRVTEVPEPTVRPLELDRAYEDSIEVGFAEDHWNFDAEPGDRIFIDVQSAGTLFTWLTVQLVAPDGSTVFEEEDTLSGFLDSGVIELDQAGTYSVRFLDPRGGTTDYSFQVWEVAPDLNQPLVFNRVYAGNLETPGKVDTYSFEGTSGQSIFLDMQQVFGSLRGVNETLVSSITSPSGVTLVDTSSFLTGPHDAGVFELTETGTYTLNLFGAGDTIPGYQFQLNDVTPGVPVPIAIDQVISDRIDSAGEIRQYTFAATVGTEFVLDVLLNRNVDPFIGEVIGWTVESPSGSILVNNSEVDASFTAPETGTYTLTVDNRNEDRGKDTTEPFAFRVIDDPAAFAPQTANLVVSNVVVDSVVVGNPAVIDVTWTVTNAGDTTAIAFGGGAWTDRVYFSADQDQQGIFSITQGDTERLVDLAPGASYQQTASFTLPVGFVGSFWVDVQADATNVVYEGDLLDDNIDQSPLLTAVYTEERAERSGPALSLSPEDGSVFPTGSQIALSGNASSTNESINAIFVIDVSRSTLEVTGLDANGDGLVDENDNLNGDASIADILDAEIGAALQLTDRLVELSDNVAVSTVLFAGGSTIADQGPEDFNQIFNAPSTTTTFRDDVTNLQQTLTSLRPDSIVDFRPDGVVAGTSFDPPIRQVEQLLAGSQDTDRTIVYFLTDGEAFDASLSVAGVADQGIEFFAFQLGGAAVTTELNELADLIDADPSSSGVAKAVTDINDLAGELISTIEIESITVNGVPVTAIDAAGNFFAPVAINAGANPVTVVATSASGATSETQINLFGDEASSIDFTSLLPASAGITSKFSGTTFNRATNQLHTSLAASNETSEGITAPLIATLDNFSTPAVDVISVDSMAPLALGGEEGPGVRGRYAYTSDVPDGTTSDFVELTLSNPLRQRFDFDVNFLVTGNRAPAFSTTPILTATPDQPYSVSVTGVDPDGDTLTIKLLQAPEGAALNGAAIEWSPTSADVGNHSFVVELSDGRGGTATQSYTAFVSTGLADAPPLITSTPTQVGTVEQLYTYDITALDPEGQSVTLTLENGPAGASVIDSQLRWTPAATDLGDYPITILATDSAGNPGRQSFNLTIRPANTPPTFVTDPVSETLIGNDYFYPALATDDFDDVNYTITGPTGISIDADSGVVSWRAEDVTVGSYPVTITATDARGLSADQPYTLTVGADTEPPTVAIASTSNLLNLGETARISLFAEDNVDVETIEMTIDGLPVTIDSNFGFEYTAETIGIREVVVTATDAAGNSASVELAPFIRVLDPSDTTPPLIEITRPAPGDVVTYLTDIVGSVTDDNLEYYEIQVALSGTNDYRTIVREVFRPGAGGSGITNNLLGVFDPTLLANDTYDVRIEAQDISGNVSRLVSPLSVEAQAKLGNFRIELTDLAVPLAGIPITIDRIYDTLDAPYGYDFGHGWRLDVGSPRIRESVRISEAEQAGGGLFGANAFRAGTRVYINSPSDGRRVGFTFDPVPEPQLLGTLWRPRFVADPGVYDRLEVDDVPLQQNQDGTFGLYLTGFAFNPSEYTLVTKDQLRYVYDQFPNSPSGIQLQSITDRNNVTLAYTENGIFSSVGPSITWTRDDQGRITEILDTAGNPLTYTYTTSGDLESFTDQVGNVTSMTYLDDPAHYLESINDPRGIQVLSLAYDEDGRLTGQGDALGNRTDQSYDLLNNTFVTEDLNGNPTTVVYDDIGNITQEIDALGNATISAYDDPNNVYQETAITDRRGNTTRFEYDDIGNLTLLEEPGRFTRFEYDSFNNNTKITGPFETLADESSARAREFVYDEDGNLAESVDALGNSTFRTVDEFGRVTSLTDRRGNTSTLVYDQLVASPTTIINPDLTTQTFTYDQVGRPLTQANELGTVVSEITYDDAGRVLTTAGADGQLTTNTYDGNLLASQSVKIDTTKSQITQFEYDGNGRIFRQTDANGGIVELTYDPQGNVLSLTDPVQNTTSYQYDVLNRQTVETNPLGNESRFVYDEVDNLVERRDRLGRRIVFIYDAMNRQVDEVWYAMDGSLVETQTYSYDVFGNLLTASSSTSTYSFAYDALDRLTSSSNAGSPETPAVILSYEFDADGNRTRVSDDSGVTIDSEYGSRNQLLSKTWFGGEVEDARVEFDYDDALRQVDILRYSDTTGTNLIGRSETDFDLTGRRTRITHLNSTDEVLANYEYEFDFANRITGQVIDDDTVAYSYDLTGQLFSADHSAPAVPDELYAYDLNGNRTESHLHGTGYITGGNNRLLSDGTSNYEYDDEGNQVRRVSIATGEMTAYEYDHRNRLVRATIRNASGDVTGSSEFVFDVFGRRITSVNDTDGDGPAGAIRENYIYDGENVWADFGETGQILTRYMFGDSIDSNIGRWRVGEESAWYLTDYIGTTRVTLNKAGEIINQTNFDAFGQILDETNESLGDRYKFTGREFDRLTETQYSRTRTYDAETGRFTSLDTISFQGNDPNLYRYVGNAPTIASDPFGTQTLIETQVSLQSVVRALPSIAAVGCILGSGVQVEFIENPGIPNAFAAATVDTVGNAAVVTGGIFAIQGTVIAAGSTITTVGAAGAVGGLVFIGAFVVCLGS